MCARAFLFLFAVEKTCHICDVACSAHLAVALQEEKLNERVKMKNREEEKKNLTRALHGLFIKSR